jgi:hypothetical protein
MKAEQHEEESDNEDGLHVVVVEGDGSGDFLRLPAGQLFYGLLRPMVLQSHQTVVRQHKTFVAAQRLTALAFLGFLSGVCSIGLERQVW